MPSKITKQDAIKVFKEQLQYLNSLGNNGSFYNSINIQRSHVADLTAKYIGPNSNLLTYISNDGLFDYGSSEENRKKMGEYLTSCIDFIEKNGIYYPPIDKRNFLGDFDNATLWVIIPLFSTLLATGAYWVGRYQEKFESNSSISPAITQSAKPSKQIPKQKQGNNRADSLKKK